MTIMSDYRAGARTLALGTPENRPAWLRASEGERRWWVALALAGAIALQVVLPRRFVLHPAYVAPIVQAVLLVVLTMAHPQRYTRRSQRLRVISQVLLALIEATNAISLGLCGPIGVRCTASIAPNGNARLSTASTR